MPALPKFVSRLPVAVKRASSTRSFPSEPVAFPAATTPPLGIGAASKKNDVGAAPVPNWITRAPVPPKLGSKSPEAAGAAATIVAFSAAIVTATHRFLARTVASGKGWNCAP